MKAYNYNLPEIVLFYLNRSTMTEKNSIGPDIPEYFVDFSAKLHEIYSNQRSNMSRPKIDPEAVERRAFHMSFFGIMNAEATRSGKLSVFNNLYPKLVLPMPESNDETIDEST